MAWASTSKAIQHNLEALEGLFRAIRTRYGQRAAILMVYNEYLKPLGLYESSTWEAMAIYGVTVVDARGAIKIGARHLDRAVAQHPWPGGHPGWRVHEVLVATLVVYALKHVLAELQCGSSPLASTAEQLHHDGAAENEVCMAPRSALTAVTGNCLVTPIFCSAPSCLYERSPLQDFDAEKIRRPEDVEAHFPAYNITPPNAWIMAPETRFHKWGWIGNNASSGEVVFKLRAGRGRLQLSYLKTYENIGTDPPNASAPSVKPAEEPITLMTPVEVDGWHSDQTSVSEEVLLHFAACSTGKESILALHVRNILSQRTGSAKFKVLAVRTF
eukprot:gene20720-24832_t